MKWTETSESTNGIEDEHTSENPYCGDLDCWCHTDVDYHDEVTHPVATEEEIDLAYAYLGLSR